MNITKLSPIFGAEIDGVDLSTIGDGAFEQVSTHGSSTAYCASAVKSSTTLSSRRSVRVSARSKRFHCG